MHTSLLPRSLPKTLPPPYISLSSSQNEAALSCARLSRRATSSFPLLPSPPSSLQSHHAPEVLYRPQSSPHAFLRALGLGMSEIVRVLGDDGLPPLASVAVVDLQLCGRAMRGREPLTPSTVLPRTEAPSPSPPPPPPSPPYRGSSPP